MLEFGKVSSFLMLKHRASGLSPAVQTVQVGLVTALELEWSCSLNKRTFESVHRKECLPRFWRRNIPAQKVARKYCKIFLLGLFPPSRKY